MLGLRYEGGEVEVWELGGDRMMEKFKEWCKEQNISPEAAILSPMWIDNWRQHVLETMSQVHTTPNQYFNAAGQQWNRRS